MFFIIMVIINFIHVRKKDIPFKWKSSIKRTQRIILNLSRFENQFLKILLVFTSTCVKSQKPCLYNNGNAVVASIFLNYFWPLCFQERYRYSPIDDRSRFYTFLNSRFSFYNFETRINNTRSGKAIHFRLDLLPNWCSNNNFLHVSCKLDVYLLFYFLFSWRIVIYNWL